MEKRYHVKQCSRRTWQVIGPSGFPIYDNEPYGRDKPLMFTNEDDALDYAERCNMDDDLNDT